MARIVVAHVSRRYSPDGLVEMRSHVPLGSPYSVDLDTIQTIQCFNEEWRQYHTKVMIQTVEPCECNDEVHWHPAGWIPLDLIELPKGKLQ